MIVALLLLGSAARALPTPEAADRAAAPEAPTGGFGPQRPTFLPDNQPFVKLETKQPIFLIDRKAEVLPGSVVIYEAPQINFDAVTVTTKPPLIQLADAVTLAPARPVVLTQASYEAPAATINVGAPVFNVDYASVYDRTSETRITRGEKGAELPYANVVAVTQPADSLPTFGKSSAASAPLPAIAKSSTPNSVSLYVVDNQTAREPPKPANATSAGTGRADHLSTEELVSFLLRDAQRPSKNASSAAPPAPSPAAAADFVVPYYATPVFTNVSSAPAPQSTESQKYNYSSDGNSTAQKPVVNITKTDNVVWVTTYSTETFPYLDPKLQPEPVVYIYPSKPAIVTISSAGAQPPAQTSSSGNSTAAGQASSSSKSFFSKERARRLYDKVGSSWDGEDVLDLDTKSGTSPAK